MERKKIDFTCFLSLNDNDKNQNKQKIVKPGLSFLKVYIVDFSLFCHYGKNIFWSCICIFLEFFLLEHSIFIMGTGSCLVSKNGLGKKMTLLLQKSVCSNSYCLWPLWIFEMQRWKLQYFQFIGHENMKKMIKFILNVCACNAWTVKIGECSGLDPGSGPRGSLPGFTTRVHYLSRRYVCSMTVLCMNTERIHSEEYEVNSCIHRSSIVASGSWIM